MPTKLELRSDLAAISLPQERAKAAKVAAKEIRLLSDPRRSLGEYR